MLAAAPAPPVPSGAQPPPAAHQGSRGAPAGLGTHQAAWSRFHGRLWDVPKPPPVMNHPSAEHQWYNWGDQQPATTAYHRSYHNPNGSFSKQQSTFSPTQQQFPTAVPQQVASIPQGQLGLGQKVNGDSILPMPGGVVGGHNKGDGVRGFEGCYSGAHAGKAAEENLRVAPTGMTVEGMPPSHHRPVPGEYAAGTHVAVQAAGICGPSSKLPWDHRAHAGEATASTIITSSGFVTAKGAAHPPNTRPEEYKAMSSSIEQDKSGLTTQHDSEQRAYIRTYGNGQGDTLVHYAGGIGDKNATRGVGILTHAGEITKSQLQQIPAGMTQQGQNPNFAIAHAGKMTAGHLQIGMTMESSYKPMAQHAGKGTESILAQSRQGIHEQRIGCTIRPKDANKAFQSALSGHPAGLTPGNASTQQEMDNYNNMTDDVGKRRVSRPLAHHEGGVLESNIQNSSYGLSANPQAVSYEDHHHITNIGAYQSSLGPGMTGMIPTRPPPQNGRPGPGVPANKDALDNWMRV